ncbi:hydrogenase iron-sulfur subunit [Methanocella arvoryzae]|uniref:CoB--CoM heterodisulfide reductase iron-sulfur subunit A n=1 Tax=Methanocella arvoryzae (strain DSM 22066 / NBRC 105507 / MRE50) TaxID=351160 RepID=Q0W899_METAR|nr:hydrogenase iron-sulfur subunit [Methanocella arvoryzae]CAJ35394.1 putative heterodisulfide reductase, subunit A [Methanocella arvoryzae MRE50]
MKRGKAGVFICHCGDNISGTVDIGAVKRAMELEGADCVEDFPYMCSIAGQALIHEKARAIGLDRIVVAACSPGVHERTFQACASEAGINPYLVDIANIREQCSWVPGENQTGRAIDIIRSSLYAVRQKQPLDKASIKVRKSVLVIGGGISGITASLALARHGIKVYLAEKATTIGGNMVKIGKVFSPDRLTEECALCSLAPLMGEVARNDRINIMTQSRVTDLRGHPGDFRVTIETGPVFIDPDKCVSCGKCSAACSVRVPDEWNAGLSSRKAVYKPFAQAVPGTYSIDPDACKRCGKCARECDARAINLNRKARKKTLRAGAIIVATGHREMDPSGKHELGYGQFPDVLTQTELARLLAINGPTKGRLEVPSTGKRPRRIVMVQCVGSRDEKPGSIPYCSKVCCMTALKHAHYVSEHFPGTEIYICYTDIRAPGTYENYYREVQKKGVKFIRGRVGEIIRAGADDSDGLLVRVEDTLGSGTLELESDMVVLSCALEPSPGTLQAASALGIGLSPELFIREKHPKLEPATTTSRGIFVCGTAQGAKDITESILQARAAASKASELVSARSLAVEPKFAVVDPERCTRCGICLKLCPYGAPYLNGKVAIDPLSCIGLGGCISRCPEHAITMPSCSDEELFARIDGCLGPGADIIAFLDENIGYVAADNAGVNRIPYPEGVRIIKVPSIMRLEAKHLVYALEKGARGVFLGDGTVNSANGAIRANVSKRVGELRAAVAACGFRPEQITYYEAYLPHFRGLASRLSQFSASLGSHAPEGRVDQATGVSF